MGRASACSTAAANIAGQAVGGFGPPLAGQLRGNAIREDRPGVVKFDYEPISMNYNQILSNPGDWLWGLGNER